MELSTQLRQVSHDLHRVAERSELMASLLRGELSRKKYTLWLLNLQAIYVALESGLARSSVLSGMDFAPLYRTDAIANDMAFLVPTVDMATCEATRRYVKHLNDLSESNSLLLLAHAYVRYLGDLHGGQLLRRCVAGVLQVDGEQGLAFYDFGPPERVTALIQTFRDGINALALDASQAAALLQEARLGFTLHIELFQQLARAGGVQVAQTLD